MKILYCIPDLSHGGAERQLSYLAAEMSRRGHEVHVASRRGGPNLDRILKAGVEWHELERPTDEHPVLMSSPFKHLRSVANLVRLIRRLRPDVVQTVLAPMDIVGGLAALVTRTRWVMRECSSGTHYARQDRWRLRLLFGRLCTALVANSAGGVDYWRDSCHPDKVHLVHNGLPINELIQRPARADRVSQEPTILFVGRIIKEKNVEALILALSLMLDTPFRAIICGDGNNRAEIERLVLAKGLADRVTFTGFVDDAWELMRHADVLVSLSRCEGCPNVVLEAMASECPVVVSDIPAHREILDEDSAIFVDPADAHSTAAAIVRVLAGEPHSARITAVARDRALGRPVSAMARQYEKIYSNLIGSDTITKELVSESLA